MVATLDTRAFNERGSNAVGINAKRAPRYRVMHKFWLDITKDGEDWLDEQISRLKRDRQYSRAVRDGLRLFLDLKAGRTAVLFELFPMLRAQIENDLLREMLAERQEVAAPVAVGQGAKPLGKVLPMDAPGPRPLAKVAPPADEDDSALLSIKKAASDGKAASQNFLDAAFNLVR